ncbi:MAG TPA: hypothetical protein VHE12_09405 [bacterium]|nr:hypothetical protein [bacterium]
MSKPVFFTILGVVLGLAAGAWAMRFYFDHTLRAWSPADRFILQLAGDLNLTPDQREKAADILADQKDRMEALRKQWRYEVETLDRQGEDRLAGILTPAQMDLYVKAHDKIHGRMDRFLWTSNADPTALAIGPGRR